MGETNKILTVSYGTFSCTLEGFDNPFSTMRSIAEYFRDLAAEDRYFGAEPPTPDPQLLHRIAEREGQRRVEARVEPDGVHLRQIGDTGQQGAAAPAELDSPAVPVAELPDTGDDSVAAKLSRIRAVVSRGAVGNGYEDDEAPATASAQPGEQPEEQPDAIEDEGADEAATAEPGSAAGMPEAEAPETAPEAAADSASQEAETEEDRSGAGIFDLDGHEAEAEAELAAGSDEDDEPEAPVHGHVTVIKGAGQGEAPGAQADHDTEADADDANPDPEAEERAMLARLDGAEDAEIAAAGDEAPGEQGDIEDLAALDGDAPEVSESGLSPDAEAALAAELAEVEALAGDETQGEAGTLAPEAPGAEVEVDRLLKTTNDKLEDDDTARRRSAIAHLKAAVAATRADREIGIESTGEGDRTTSYRDDLARVVRPARPTGAGSSAGQRPRPRTEPPLVLVSDYRVDKPGSGAGAATAINPRRVSAAQLHDDLDTDTDEDAGAEGAGNIFASESFADYAERVGAHSLPDLLEASAAYIAFVEGRAHFNRAMVVEQVRIVTGRDAHSREDVMRAFGTLLRERRIRKEGRGRFAVAPDTRFRPADVA